MLLTNNLGLPDVVMRAIKADPYSKGDSDYSVTELLNPAPQSYLARNHPDEITEDISDRLYSLYGNMKHYVLELGAQGSDIAERRFFAEIDIPELRIDPFILSGQADLIEFDWDRAILTDWKTTSVWQVVNINSPDSDTKHHWEAQLNMLAYLVNQNLEQDPNLKPITDIQIIVFMRDWSPNGKYRSSDYPKVGVQKVSLELWDQQETEDFIKAKITDHFKQTGESICTPEERWQSPDKFAVMGKNRKSAFRVLDSEESADSWMKENKKGDYIELRPSEPKRCNDYCSVKHLCEFGKSLGLKEVA